MSGRRRHGSTPAPAGGQDPKRMRRSLVGAGGSEPLCTQGAGPSEVLPSSGVEKGSWSAPALARDLTVDEHLLECGVCYLPLKPPIFQCGMGHVLCSPCSAKLKDARKCHVCGKLMPDGYQRCHAMEDMMNSIRGPCPHAAYGCEARPVYHAREEHLRECPHAPCRCPGDGCSFLGSVTSFVEHAAAVHNWPCTAEGPAGRAFYVSLHDGFNFITAVRFNTQCLLLLNMARTPPFGHAISVVQISSPATLASHYSTPATRNTTCSLELYYSRLHKNVLPEHYHVSKERSCFPVQCRCPSNGLPDPNASFQLFIPKYDGGSYEATILVSAIISVSSS